MVTITVSLQKERIYNNDLETMVHKAWVGNPRQVFQDFQFSNVTEVEVILKKGWFGTRIDLSPELHKGIVDFLNIYQRNPAFPPFDCYAFVNLVHGIEPHTCSYVLRFWDVVPLSAYPVSGDTLIFINEELKSFRHAAICIGHDMYISVYGGDGDLEFSSLIDMKEGFGATKVFLATPRCLTDI